MADNTRSNWAAFLFEMQGKVWEVFPSESPFLAELSGYNKGDPAPRPVGRFTQDMDGGRDVFSGDQVRHSLILAYLQGGGWVSETQTWNRPHSLDSKKIFLNLCRMLVPFSVSVDVERDSLNNSNANAVAQLIRQTRIALARLENYTFLGDGTAKVSDITDTANTLTITTPAGTNYDVLLPGTSWDICTKSTGVPVTGGKRRKIVSVVESTGVVTFDTAQQASDGDSGNINHAATDGIFICGSATVPASAGTLAAQGLEQAAAVTGTFEGLDKAATPQWQGTDGRAGDTNSLPLSDQMLGAGVRRGRRAGIGTWDYGIGDPAVIDLYKDGKLAQVRYEEKTGAIKSGFSGIVYDGADSPFPLIKEPAHKKLGLKLVDNSSFQLYGDKPGPSFLEDDGGFFRRFNPTLLKEADMLDRVQMGVTKCNTIVFFNNLAAA